jgi:hypothetical protein
MINRKAALLACREGQWIRTAGMQGLRLNARIAPDVELHLCQIMPDGAECWMKFGGPGVYSVEEADWSRVIVVSGPHSDALCFLESKVA